MTRSRLTFTLAAVLLGIGATACPPYARQRPLVERLSPEIPPSRFHVIGTIAGGGSRTDLQISATVRQLLADSGVTAVRAKGRFDTQADAVREVCDPTETPSLDGVLFVWYNRMELHDCTTQRAAYEISGGQLGITQMTDRLVAYLRRGTPVQP